MIPVTTSLAFVLSILHSWPNRIVAFFLFLFIVLFVVQFFVPAFRLKRKLNRVIDKLKAVKEANEAGVVDLEAIAGQAMAVGNLQHLWSAYAFLLPAR